MITVTSVEAQSRFGELIDRSQREPVEVTRHGLTEAFVVSGHDIQILADVTKRLVEAAPGYAQYRSQVEARGANDLSDEDVTRLVHELR